MKSVSAQLALPVPGCLVVGIGASAGGLSAFKTFFTNMPADSGMAFVLVPHLDPSHGTVMVELVARCTPMKVQEVRDGMRLVPDEVFVIPPNKYLTVDRGVLRLMGPVQRSQTAIDCFLQSLAADQRENAVGIILSGTGAHGMLGIKAIKASGGLAMVQEPSSAEHDSMPRRAIETGVIDCVRRAEEMPDTLVRYATQLRAVRGEPADDPSRDLDQLIALLRSKLGHDFSHYRKPMLMRRIERRMSLCRVDRLADYVDVVQSRPEEAAHLVKDLLIRVTGFFRDPAAFEVLKLQVLPKLLAEKAAETALRVWVAGCATGEEAYSVAMLIQEQLVVNRKSIPLTILATDVDEEALAVARRGVYPDTSVSSLSIEQVARFFSKQDHGFRVGRELRDSVTFSRHNVITDAPFARLDLVCCRNLLIYFEPSVQRQILRILHYALDPGGYLLLGRSETLGGHADLFEPVARKWRIFRRIGTTSRITPVVTAAPVTAGTGERSAVSTVERHRSPAELTKHVLLEVFAPAAVLIDRQQRVLYFHGATERFLNQPSGEPTTDIVALARDGMRTRLRAAITECLSQDRAVVSRVRIRRASQYHAVTLTVQPVRRSAAGSPPLLVTFVDEPVIDPVQDAGVQAVETPLVRQLEDDLTNTRRDLQATIEDMVEANEQLKTSNEEVMSMNEELQSAHEEMETSKEELQSLNEELSSSNSQLVEKIDELERANNDLSNLLSSTDIALLFLDSSLCITRFTRPATKLFHLIDRDIGRPLRDIARRFTDVDLLTDAASMLETKVVLEKEIDADEGRRYLRRIAPYRTSLDRVEGVAITFLDVTHVKQAAQHERWLATVMTDSNDAILVTDLSGKIQSWNRGATAIYGYQPSEMIGVSVEQLVPAWLHVELRDLISRMSRGDHVRPIETQRLHKDGHVLDVWLTMTALRDDEGRSIAIAMTESDITSRRALEREVLEIAASEQQRIGQDLHDNTGQELTGLGLMAQSLADVLAQQSAGEAALAAKIAAGLRMTLTHVRALAKGLVPVEIDASGLTSALADLAAQTSSLHGINCVFASPRPVPLSNFTATHLYRIAQEAVTNSIKHGPAQSIIVTLATADDVGVLEIIDDGVGIGDPERRGDGIGLQIMSYRARLIGATLHVERGVPTGTRVTCTFSAAAPTRRNQTSS